MAVRTNVSNAIPEEGSIGFTVSFTDENGDALVPDSLTWTLTDERGAVMNSREDVSMSVDSSVTIVLSGDDLAIGDNGTRRVLTLEYVYTSDLGASLPDKHEVAFTITDLIAV
jgi:hypothetical protein